MNNARLSRYPVTVHSTCDVVALKSRLNCGTATLITVVSTMSMNSPKMNTMATSHLYSMGLVDAPHCGGRVSVSLIVCHALTIFPSQTLGALPVAAVRLASSRGLV